MYVQIATAEVVSFKHLICDLFFLIFYVISVTHDYRYLKSTIGNISLIHRFRRKNELDDKNPEEKICDFWMEFFDEAVKTKVDGIRFPVSSTGAQFFIIAFSIENLCRILRRADTNFRIVRSPDA